MSKRNTFANAAPNTLFTGDCPGSGRVRLAAQPLLDDRGAGSNAPLRCRSLWVFGRSTLISCRSVDIPRREHEQLVVYLRGGRPVVVEFGGIVDPDNLEAHIAWLMEDM